MVNIVRCEVKLQGENGHKAKENKEKKVQWSIAKKKDCDEPHLGPNEKM